MARIIVVTGGSRSGKSAYAQKLAENLPAPRVYIATAPVTDDEMRERICKHQAAREKLQWKTIEETVDLAGAIRTAGRYPVVLVDCLTLWISNLLYEAERKSKEVTEESIAEKCRNVMDACNALPGTVIFVTNEVGMGIVPDNPLARRFTDLAGRCNQIMAQHADAVTFMVSGQPLFLKGGRIL